MGTGACARPHPCLAGTFRREDRPPTHFFVKKKFSSIGGADSTTQKVSSVFCCAHAFCKAKRCATHGIPQSGLPPDGGIPAMPPTLLWNVSQGGRANALLLETVGANLGRFVPLKFAQSVHRRRKLACLPCQREGDRRRTSGTTVVEGFRSWQKIPSPQSL